MANIVLPTVIQGPAYIGHGGVFIYVQDDVQVSEQVDSWNPGSWAGPLGERHKGRVAKITATPVGQLTAGLLNYFYAAHKSPSTTVGKSIVPASNYALTVYSISENKTYGFVRAGLSKPPQMNLSPNKPVFGSAEWTCLPDIAAQPTSATFFKAAVGASFTPDTSFEEDNVITDIWSLAIGAQSSPYNAVGGMDGFALDFGYMTKAVMAGDVGTADIILTGLATGCSFAPSNLTEAQVNTLTLIQDTGAVMPGQAYAKGKETLAFTGTQSTWAMSLVNMGPKRSDRIYQSGTHRFRVVEYVNQRVWTTGAEVALFSFTAPA